MLPDHDVDQASRLVPDLDQPEERPAIAAGITVAFVLVHLFLLVIVLGPEKGGGTDVNLYEWWMNQAGQTGAWPVRDVEIVYPCVSVIPMFLAYLLSHLPGLTYMVSWLGVVTLLNAVACWVLWRFAGRRQAALGIVVWLGFLALLGPTALTRVDSVAAPLIVMGLAVAVASPPVATILLTVGAWVKVAPGAVVIGLLATARNRIGSVIVPGAAACLVIVGTARLFGGSWGSIVSFFTSQADRGLQVESVAATPFVLARAMSKDKIADFNDVLGTYEVLGSGPMAVASALNWALIVVAAGIGLMAYRARHNGEQALPVAALAILTAMIVTNKVGSPQFVAWIGPPVAVALARYPASWWWRIVAFALGVIALFTHLLYPTIYFAFLDGKMAAVLIETLRNIGLVALMVAASWHLWQLGRKTEPSQPEIQLDKTPSLTASPSARIGP